MAAGVGPLVLDFAFPEPSPAPVTTIAWRLGHLLVGVLGMRNASHFGGPPISYQTVEWPEGAAAALKRLDAAYEHWMSSIVRLDGAALAQPAGEAEGPFADEPMATLILHIHREVIHHGAEILLLRDLHGALVRRVDRCGSGSRRFRCGCGGRGPSRCRRCGPWYGDASGWCCQLCSG
jgi:hypothetical protein